MLVISRAEGESIKVGDEIEVHVIRLSTTRVRIGIKAPMEMRVLHNEIVERVEKKKD